NVETPTIKLQAPTRKGYTFGGWFSDTAMTKNVKGISKGSIGNRTFYAKWTANQYSITFNGNGATSGNTASKSCKYGSSYKLTKNGFKRIGYTFNGWNSKKNGSGTAYADQASVKNLKSTNGARLTLYAQWKNNEYTLIFNGNGADSGTMKNKVCKYGTSYNLTKNVYKKTGYKFTGWNTKANGSGIAYANKASVSNLTTSNGARITLYAQWKLNTPTIKVEKGNYERNEISVSSSSFDCTYQIYRSNSKNGTYKLIATQTSSEFDDKNVKSGQKYFYKTRCYTKGSGGKKIYSDYSKPIAITTALKPSFSASYEVQYGKSAYISSLTIENHGKKTLSVGDDPDNPSSLFGSIWSPVVYPYKGAVKEKTTMSSDTINIAPKQSKLILLMGETKRYYSSGAHVIFFFWYDGCFYTGSVSIDGTGFFL
ncbi:MAG: InlB B-repeat-containing protein, partial [Bacillus sp. (in: Bacteria)]|nr:InlB B-repeat-containing protein [Bacillus sp. (in: firmicutes)]